MPGKVNPVIPEVVLQVCRPGDRQRHRDHDRRLAGQLRAQRARAADRAQPARVDPLLAATARIFAEKCVERHPGQRGGRQRSAESTLAAATALNPYIGYDKGAEIVKEAASSGRMLREVAYEKGVDEETYNKAMDLREMARGNHLSSRGADAVAGIARRQPSGGDRLGAELSEIATSTSSRSGPRSPTARRALSAWRRRWENSSALAQRQPAARTPRRA